MSVIRKIDSGATRATPDHTIDFGGGGKETKDPEKAKKFNRHFSKMPFGLSGSQKSISKQAKKDNRNFFAKWRSGGREGALEAAIELKEIEDAIGRINNRRAPGADGICGEFVKRVGPWGLQSLRLLFNKCLGDISTPQLWRRIALRPLVKKAGGAARAWQFQTHSSVVGPVQGLREDYCRQADARAREKRPTFGLPIRL